MESGVATRTKPIESAGVRDASLLFQRDAKRVSLVRVLLSLLLFGISFGYVEAALVTYLRAIYDPMRERLYPSVPAGELFPLIRLDQLAAEGPEHLRRLGTEMVREAATLVLLAAASLAVARSARQFLAAFMIAFGVWDIFYYVFLKLLIDWPASLLTWDILFLLPVPWAGPVLAPVIVSLSMIATGIVLWWRETTNRPLQLGRPHWAAIVVGGLTIIVAFCWDFRNTSAGGMPQPFHWPLFALGELLGLGSFLHGLAAGRR